MTMRVFVDSDVVISSLISSQGAAYLLLNQANIKPVITSISLKEIKIVAERMNLPIGKLELLVENNFEVQNISGSINQLKTEYGNYVTDENDAHIVAGVRLTKVKYMITYNLRHFKTEKIKDNFDVLILTPALFMQYLRSQS